MPNTTDFREWFRERVGAVSIRAEITPLGDTLVHTYQLCWSNEADMITALLSYDFDVLDENITQEWMNGR